MMHKSFATLRKKRVLIFAIHKILAEIKYIFEIFDNLSSDVYSWLSGDFEPSVLLDI